MYSKTWPIPPIRVTNQRAPERSSRIIRTAEAERHRELSPWFFEEMFESLRAAISDLDDLKRAAEVIMRAYDAMPNDLSSGRGLNGGHFDWSASLRASLILACSFRQPDGQKERRYQYAAIDDATRIRALKIYEKHTQENVISFVDYVIGKFPFRIHTIRTDSGHEFRVKFHCHVLDLGMDPAYIKPRTPRLNGKVERTHSTDQQEFYQLLSYKDDVDLGARLKEWETFYNRHRPHASLKGKNALRNSAGEATIKSNVLFDRDLIVIEFNLVHFDGGVHAPLLRFRVKTLNSNFDNWATWL